MNIDLAQQLGFSFFPPGIILTLEMLDEALLLGPGQRTGRPFCLNLFHYYRNELPVGYVRRRELGSYCDIPIVSRLLCWETEFNTSLWELSPLNQLRLAKPLDVTCAPWGGVIPPHLPLKRPPI